MFKLIIIKTLFNPPVVQYTRPDTSRKWHRSTRTSRTSRTGLETVVYESYKWWIAYHWWDLGCITSGTTRTSRTSRTGRETMVYESYKWWIVYHWWDWGCIASGTTRTSRTTCNTPQVSLMIYNSPLVRLVNHYFTTCTARTTRTSRTTCNTP